MAMCLAVLPSTSSSFHTNANEANAAVRMFLNQLFNAIDTAKRGKFNFREIMMFIANLLRWKNPGAMVNFVFKFYDMDADGEVDCIEMQTMVKVGNLRFLPLEDNHSVFRLVKSS